MTVWPHGWKQHRPNFLVMSADPLGKNLHSFPYIKVFLNFCHHWMKISLCRYLYGFLSLDINYHYSVLLRLCHVNILVSDIDRWSPEAGLSAFTFHSRTDLFLWKKKKKRKRGLISTSSVSGALWRLALKTTENNSIGIPLGWGFFFFLFLENTK